VAAVRASTASADPDPGPRVPIRTCIGCRQRATAAELLRVVATPSASGPGDPVQAVPDPRHRASGRGAWLHRDPGCVELAERRRAFARALHVPGSVDPTPIREYVAQYGDPTSGHPQE
jgi:hypothetical protein